MNIQIITSSYPATPDDPSGTAGLFVREFALELARLGHRVVVQPAARKQAYAADPSLIVWPTPWLGGDRELASFNLFDPRNWHVFLHYLYQGIRTTQAINVQYDIDRTLCMWVVPSGLLAYLAQRGSAVPYDVWALGSDIWKIGRVPVAGKRLLCTVIGSAAGVFADGVQLGEDVQLISGVNCSFLPSSRKLPDPAETFELPGKGVIHFAFIGRYHHNKGPDLLIQAVALLPREFRGKIRVHMFGLGPLEDGLREMVAASRLTDCVTVGGAIAAQDLASCLSAVSFLVIPSRVESIPVVFSDALQMGTPIVAMPVGDLRSLITRFGCGIVAREVSAQALAVALIQAVDSTSGVFRAGIARASEQFNIEATVKTWLGTWLPAQGKS